QQSQQQYMRQQQHHDYSQQSQVANVTGQPIMAATGPPQIPIAYSAAAAAAAHHHNQQVAAALHHSQQPQNIAAAAAAAQLAATQPHPPNHQPMPYMAYPGFPVRHLLPQGHPQAINLATGQLQ